MSDFEKSSLCCTIRTHTASAVVTNTVKSGKEEMSLLTLSISCRLVSVSSDLCALLFSRPCVVH
jgi:hypothetical protein